MRKRSAALRLGLVFVLATGLAACRESEQDRRLWLEPGVYTGEKDEKLSERQRDALRERARLQGY